MIFQSNTKLKRSRFCCAYTGARKSSIWRPSDWSESFGRLMRPRASLIISFLRTIESSSNPPGIVTPFRITIHRGAVGSVSGKQWQAGIEKLLCFYKRENVETLCLQSVPRWEKDAIVLVMFTIIRWKPFALLSWERMVLANQVRQFRNTLTSNPASLPINTRHVLKFHFIYKISKSKLHLSPVSVGNSFQCSGELWNFHIRH